MELVRSIWLSSSAVGGVCGARILVACGVGGLSNSTTVIVPLDLAAGRMADAGAQGGR